MPRFLFYLFFDMYFYLCVCVLPYMYLYVCVEARHRFWLSSFFLIAVILSSTLMDLTRLPGQQAAEILLSAIPHWEYRCGLPQWTLQSGAGDLNAESYACVTKVYIWKSPPNPSIII